MLYKAIHGIRIPFDLVIGSPSVLKENAQTPATVFRYALREGKELYAA